MAQEYYETWFRMPSTKEKLARRVLDPDGLLSGNGYVRGVYVFWAVNQSLQIEIPIYIGQAGDTQTGTAPSYVASDVYERLLQHLKRWFGGSYYTYWTGLEDNDDWKIKIKLLCEEDSHSERLKKESEYISKLRPVHQDTLNGKYDLYPTRFGYKRNDLAIHPWTRQDEDEGQRALAFKTRLGEITGKEQLPEKKTN